MVAQLNPFLLNANKLSSKIAIGVSGGADSMALLHMLHAAGAKLTAFTVDHQLRTDSAAEAQMVAAYCATLNIPHYILNWTDAKPHSGVQAKAGQARRALLLQACRDHDIADLYLAHQADDQIETMLQRLARGAGPQGLSGIQSIIMQSGVTIHRPLLHIRRADLRAYCTLHHVPFIDDPSNNDTRYERIRWRNLVSDIEQQQPGFVSGILRSRNRLDAAAQAITVLAMRWIETHVVTQDNKTNLPLSVLQTEPQALIVEILRRLMTTDKAYKVDLERLEQWVAQAFSDAPQETALTLDRWWLRLTKDKITLQLAPERMHKTA